MRSLKNLVILSFFCIGLLLCACDGNSSKNFVDLSSKVKIEIHTISDDDGVKVKNIDYPSIGGLPNSDTMNAINKSLYNYVNNQVESFDKSVTDLRLPEKAKDSNKVGSTSEDNSNSDDQKEVEGSVNKPTIVTTDKEYSSNKLYLDMKFTVTYNENNILNVVESYENYSEGALSYVGKYSLVYDLEANELLTLGTIFDFENTDFVQYVDGEIKAQLEKGTYELYDDSFTGISKTASFYVEDGYFYIYFDALDISPNKNILPTFQFKVKDLNEYMYSTYQGRFR